MQRPSRDELQVLALLRCNDTISSRVAVLVTLLGCETEACQVGLLATNLGAGVSALSMVGDALVKDGLVDRCYPIHDMRKTSFALTSLGREAAYVHLGLLRRMDATTEAPTSARRGS